jgi:hypothetical protein
MRRTKMGLLPAVDVMEPRLVLSTAAPLLSQHELRGVVREVKAIVSTLAKTGSAGQASAELTALASRIPSGPEALAPSWQSDIGLYRPHSTRSITMTEKRILGDLYRYLNGPNQTVSASGSTTPVTPIQGTANSAAPTPTPVQGTASAPPPVPAPTLDSVTIENTTGMALVVTVHLDVPEPYQPWIAETIPAQGDPTMLFNFGTATNAFMTMDVKAADGAQTPPPWTNISLSQPTSGYNGALFTISLFGPYFNVSVS